MIIDIKCSVCDKVLYILDFSRMSSGRLGLEPTTHPIFLPIQPCSCQKELYSALEAFLGWAQSPLEDSGEKLAAGLEQVTVYALAALAKARGEK